VKVTKKQLVIIGIVALLVCVGLSGCNQQSSGGNLSNPYSSAVEISNLKVTTKWSDGFYNGKHGQIDGFSYQDIPAGMNGYYEL